MIRPKFHTPLHCSILEQLEKDTDFFTVTIDLKTWPRRQMFWYFSEMAPTGYSITVDMDVTGLRTALKTKGYRFLPTYLWLVTKCLNEQMEFKIARKGDVLGYYDTLTPLYASFHEDDKTFSLMWSEFQNDLDAFHQQYCDHQQRFAHNHGVLCQPETPPENAYTVSTIPWISFNHFAVHSYDNKPYFFPSIEAGKIRIEGSHEFLPFSMTCHHATTDGYHVQVFLNRLQQEIDGLR